MFKKIIFIMFMMNSINASAVNLDFPPKIYQLVDSLGYQSTLDINGFSPINTAVEEWTSVTYGDKNDVQLTVYYGFGFFYKATITYNNPPLPKEDRSFQLTVNKNRAEATRDMAVKSLESKGYRSGWTRSINGQDDTFFLGFFKEYYTSNQTLSEQYIDVKMLTSEKYNYVLTFDIEKKDTNLQKKTISATNTKKQTSDRSKTFE